MKGVVKSVEVRYQVTASGLYPVVFVEFEDGGWSGAQLSGGISPTMEDHPLYRMTNAEPLGRAIEVLQDAVIADLKDRSDEAHKLIHEIAQWMKEHAAWQGRKNDATIDIVGHPLSEEGDRRHE